MNMVLYNEKKPLIEMTFAFLQEIYAARQNVWDLIMLSVD